MESPNRTFLYLYFITETVAEGDFDGPIDYLDTKMISCQQECCAGRKWHVASSTSASLDFHTAILSRCEPSSFAAGAHCVLEKPR